MADWTMKLGDTTPGLTAVLRDGAKRPIDLSGSTVKLMIKSQRTRALVMAVVVTQLVPAAGSVFWDWATQKPDAAGLYNVEFEIKFADGKEITVPNNKYLVLEVLAELG